MKENIFDQCLEKITDAISILPDKPEETPLNTLKALYLKAAGIPVSVVKAETHELPELNEEEINTLYKLIDKRLQGVPLAHITRRQSFMGLEMLAGPQALIPRKETEILAHSALEILRDLDADNITVIDVCTGAGNIALSIAGAIENADIYAADLSEDAVDLARENADLLGLSSQVKFYSGDLLQPFETLDLYAKVHLLSCNPPYISSSKVQEMPQEISSFEPQLAFDGGSFGINLIRRLISEADKFLIDGGYLVFEVGLGQGDVIKKQVEKTGLYSDIRMINDEAGMPRVIIARKALS